LKRCVVLRLASHERPTSRPSAPAGLVSCGAVPKAGGDAIAIAKPTNLGVGVAVDAERVYWIESDRAGATSIHSVSR
jgi:hypothetical protein